MMLFTDLSNEELLAEVSRLALRERQATAALIRCLMEVDGRRLYLSEGYPSLFTFCTQALHLSEHAALGRIEVARAARRLPALLRHLEDGSVTVTNARMLAPHMTEANCEDLLAAARHRSKRDVEEIVARLRPQPDVRSTVCKLPSSPIGAAPLPVLPAATPVSTRPLIAPLAPERYKIQFTASRETHDKLRYAQNLLRHLVPSGDVAVVFDRALSALIDQLEKQKCAATSRPRRSRGATGSRHIPAAVRREVWHRDQGCCAFIGARGRCAERGFLEFHHVVPFAAGGAADANNIELRCRAHNLYEADLFFGPEVVRESGVAWDESVRTEFVTRCPVAAGRRWAATAVWNAPPAQSGLRSITGRPRSRKIGAAILAASSCRVIRVDPRPPEAGRGRPVPARRSHGSGEPPLASRRRAVLAPHFPA